MSKERFCPECGQPADADERFCRDCGAEVPFESNDDTTTAEEMLNKVKPSGTTEPIIGAGARANVSGGINQSSMTHANINTSSVDNSSTVHHNTTIVMEKDEAEYCEVCGNPFDDRHARCPKCGKEICFDCKVKGKNRCVECEKKSINEYRLAFQQLLLTTNSNIGIAGRQMMDQKARELDVEDTKADIEKEMTELYKPANKATQPAVVSASSSDRPVQSQEASQKGVGALTGSHQRPIPKSGSSKSKWIPLSVILLAVVVGYIFMSKKDEPVKNAPVTPPTEQKQTGTKQETPTVQSQTTPPVTASEKKEVQTEKVPSQPVAEKKDADYDAGMTAFDNGKGLDAVRLFKKSGSAKSYYMLGLIYENGCGTVGSNGMMARKNFKKAADMGHKDAKAKL